MKLNDPTTATQMINHLNDAATGVGNANVEYHKTDANNAGLFQDIPKA